MFSTATAAKLPDYQPGDIIVFDAAADLFSVSTAIKLGTCSAHTHVALCAEVHGYELGVYAKRGDWPWSDSEIRTWKQHVVLFESTTLTPDPCIFQGRPFRGVQAHEVERRVRRYDGRVWRMRLREPMSELESQALALHLLDSIGTPYDDRGAVLSATLFAKHGLRAARASDRSTLFCCEILLAAVQLALSSRRKFTYVDAGTLSPAGVVRWARQLWGPLVQVA